MQYHIGGEYESVASWGHIYKFDTPLEAMYTPGKPELKIGSNEWTNELEHNLSDYFRHRRTTARDTWRRIPDDCRGTSTEYPERYIRDGMQICRTTGIDPRTGNFLYELFEFRDGESFCRCVGEPIRHATGNYRYH